MSDKKTEATEKPLEKMTVKALREIAKEIPEITGAHGMKKEELLVAIKEVRGVNAETAETETDQAETAETETGQAETAETETGQAETAETEPGQAEPVKAEPVKAEPVKAEPVKAEPVKAEPVKAEPVKADKSIKGKAVKKTGSTTGEIKRQIKALKAQRQAALEAQDPKMATVYKRRISRLKKKSRKAAA